MVKLFKYIKIDYEVLNGVLGTLDAICSAVILGIIIAIFWDCLSILSVITNLGFPMLLLIWKFQVWVQIVEEIWNGID